MESVTDTSLSSSGGKPGSLGVSSTSGSLKTDFTVSTVLSIGLVINFSILGITALLSKSDAILFTSSSGTPSSKASCSFKICCVLNRPSSSNKSIILSERSFFLRNSAFSSKVGLISF